MTDPKAEGVTYDTNTYTTKVVVTNEWSRTLDWMTCMIRVGLTFGVSLLVGRMVAKGTGRSTWSRN